MDKDNNTSSTSVKTGPKDVFLQLLVIVTLYMSAISFGTLLFQFVNIAFPDPLVGSYAARGAAGAMRFALAMLIVVFPVFVWVSRYIKKEIKKAPAVGEMRIRKWLLSFTLFAAGLLIIGDLIAVVNRYLAGELSVRFTLKVLIILFIAGIIFRYYLWQLRDKTDEVAKPMKWLEQGVIALVGIVLVAGFVLAGSPQSERQRRFDERRVNDLSSVQWQVVSFWQDKDRLPDNLDELADSISGYRAPLDPQTGDSYEYSVTGDLSFELCANFDTESSQSSPALERYPVKQAPGGTFDNWAHSAGRVCFERTIDPEIYGDNRGMNSEIKEIPI